MEKLMTAFKNLLHHDVPHFLLACVRVGIALLFFVSLFFTFFRVIGPGLENPIGANEFPGAGIFIALWLLSIPAYVYFLLMDDKKTLRSICIVQPILASVYFFWGLILFSTTASLAQDQISTFVYMGFGLVLQVLLIGLLWFLTFGDQIAMRLVLKFAKQPVVVAEAPVPIEKTE